LKDLEQPAERMNIIRIRNHALCMTFMTCGASYTTCRVSAEARMTRPLGVADFRFGHRRVLEQICVRRQSPGPQWVEDRAGTPQFVYILQVFASMRANLALGHRGGREHWLRSRFASRFLLDLERRQLERGQRIRCLDYPVLVAILSLLVLSLRS